MKVKDLIMELSQYDGEADIFMSRDSEGNGFANVECAEMDEDGPMKNAKKVILWPTHERLEEV